MGHVLAVDYHGYSARDSNAATPVRARLGEFAVLRCWAYPMQLTLRRPNSVAEEEHDWNGSPLTKPSLDDYQTAIAKAITELTGKEFRVHIANFTRTPEWAGSHGVLCNNAEMTIRISTP